jgi:hypothetical protein
MLEVYNEALRDLLAPAAEAAARTLEVCLRVAAFCWCHVCLAGFVVMKALAGLHLCLDLWELASTICRSQAGLVAAHSTWPAWTAIRGLAAGNKLALRLAWPQVCSLPHTHCAPCSPHRCLAWAPASWRQARSACLG